jgi:hypothetical protein
MKYEQRLDRWDRISTIKIRTTSQNNGPMNIRETSIFKNLNVAKHLSYLNLWALFHLSVFRGLGHCGMSLNDFLTTFVRIFVQFRYQVE